MTKQMIIGFIILGILSLSIGLFMQFDVLNTKPLYVKFYASITFAVCAVLTYIAVFSHDNSSSRKTDDILENTKKIGTGVYDLNDKVDTSNYKIDGLVETNSQLFQNTKNIYDLNKTTKFPMPSNVTVSYMLIFQLDKKFQDEAHQILTKKEHFDSGIFTEVNPLLIYDILDWNITCEWLTVVFLKNYKEEQPNDLIIGFTNFDTRLDNSAQRINQTIAYNPSEKSFLINVKNVPLYKQENLFGNLTTNLLPTSIQDLANSTMLFSQPFPNRFNSMNISHFKITSTELNLTFWKLNNSKNNKTFTVNVE